jgi:hypothetical protein
MAEPHASQRLHNVLQLHGGGALVLSQLIKCAILEETTGRRIPDLFPSIIADSGGAIIACCMHFISAKDLLKVFMEEIPDILPNNSFLFRQPLPKTRKRFDPVQLRDKISEIVGDHTLADIPGNIFIRTHSIENKATRISKTTLTDGTETYKNASAETPLIDIVLKASAVPGIMPERDDDFMDPIADQNPFAIIHQLKRLFPDDTINYVQLGNVHNVNLPYLLRTKSFIRNLVTGAFQSYSAYHGHFAHLEDLSEILAPEYIHSLTTFSPGRFSSIDNSIGQRTRLAVATFADIRARQTEYKTLIQALGSLDALSPLPDSIKTLEDDISPFLLRQKIVTDDPSSLDETQFPSPIIVPTHSTRSYRSGYALGTFCSIVSPQFTRACIKYDFKVGNAFQSAAKKLLGQSYDISLPHNKGGSPTLPPSLHSNKID